MSSWAREYLDLIQEDTSLCLPFLDLDLIADRLGVPAKTLRSRRQVRKDVREQEAEIIAGHVGRLRAQALESGDVGADEEEDLPHVLGRYLEVYAELDREGTGGRQDAVRVVQGEGLPLSWQDVVEARRRYPAFDRALSELWDEGNLAIEDRNRQKAMDGNQTAIALHLRGNMAGKYGNKARIDHVHHVGDRLDDGDLLLVEDVKGRYFPRPLRRQVPASVEDVVEGEVLESS